MLYIEAMSRNSRRRTNAALLALALLLGGCGGRKISNQLARDAIIDSPAAALTSKDVEVVSITQMASGEAVVTTNLRAAFRIARTGGKWEIREVKVGNGDWESLDSILQALLQIKIGETRRRFEQIAASIEAYRAKYGRLPAFRNYVELSDALSPEFLKPLIRHDAWNHPLEAAMIGIDTIRLTSPGPDGKQGTQDDIEFTRSFPMLGGS